MGDDELNELIEELAEDLAANDLLIARSEKQRLTAERMQSRVQGKAAKEAIALLADVDRGLMELREVRARRAVLLERAKALQSKIESDS